MLRHAIQRLLLAIPVLFGVLLIGFLLMQVVPTDPAVVRAGPTATQDVIDAIRRDLGLDRPLWVQFGLYLWRLAQGDLGVSIINNVPVRQELAATIGPTLELMVASLIWAIPLGIAKTESGTDAYWWVVYDATRFPSENAQWDHLRGRTPPGYQMIVLTV